MSMFSIRADGWQRFFVDWAWWKRTLSTVFRFAPRCIAPAIGLTIANVAVVLCTFFMQRQMQGAETLEQLIAIAVMAVAVTVFALSVCFWALGVWLIKLTAFARAFMLERSNPSDADFIEAEQLMKARKWYLLKVWLFASALLMVPAFPLCLLVAMRVLVDQSKQINDPTILPIPAALVTPEYQAISMIAMVVLTIVSMVYSFEIVVATAVSEESPVETAIKTLKQTMKHGPVLLAVTTLIMFVNFVVTTPQLIAEITPWSAIVRHSALLQSLAQVWLGITSVVIWPLSLTPFCEMAEVSSDEAVPDGH